MGWAGTLRHGLHVWTWVEQARFRGPRDGDAVAITIDDGPCLEHSLALVTLLNRRGARASFFWLSDRARALRAASPEYFQALRDGIREGGHEVGVHAPDDYQPTLATRLLGKLTYGELSTAKQVLEELVDSRVRLYRPHYVQLGPEVVHATALGLATVFGNVGRYFIDPLAPAARQIERLSQAPAGTILVFHESATMRRPGSRILEVLPDVLERLRARGLRAERASAVLGLA
ncbi:polysaccharide deacetylase family protein [bacterium]|nr:polysaccharide deacetylase family protein [bacterium]